MGVGTPANILEAVDRGVDFFDCVYPSKKWKTWTCLYEPWKDESVQCKI